MVGNNVYLAGGSDAAGNALTTVESMTIGASSIFSALAPLPAARMMAAGAAVNGIVYVAGGQDGSHDRAELYGYSPGTNSWSTLAPMPGGRYQGSGAATINGRLYVVGGWDNTSTWLPHNTLFEYNPATNSWATRAAMPTLSAGGACGVVNGKLYVTTAQNGYSGTAKLLHVWDPVADAWTSLPSSASAHSTPAAGVIGGKFYVVGGGDGVGGISSTLEAYDPAANAWTTLAPMPEPRTGASGTVANGKLYVIGGSTASGISTAVSVYDPVSNSWSNDVPMTAARSLMASGMVGNNVYLAGGSDAAGNALTTVESMSPVVPSAPLSVLSGGTGAAFAISGLAPNPSTGHSRISFSTASTMRVRLTLIDVQGRQVALLSDGVREAGQHVATLDAAGLRTGVYFVRVQANGASATRRLVVVR
jgi:hypothetical protein